MAIRYPASRNGTPYDSMLFVPDQAPRGNEGLNLYIRVYLQEINPAGSAATGTRADYDGVDRQIVRWPAGAFVSWSQRYQRECQGFWDNKFWLITPDTYREMDYQSGSQRLRPNVRCNFYLSLVQARTSAHHSIEVVQLAASEMYFRSDSAHYDHRDLDPTTYGAGLVQRAHVHEVGHLLGLGHSGESDPACVDNNPVCYAGSNVMGQGEDLDATNALPWRLAMSRLTGIDSDRWTVSLTEVPPRVL